MMSRLSAGVKTQMQQSQLAFQHVMNELLKQELDGPVSLSLLQYTGNVMDIELILDMTDEEIDGLHYFTPEVDSSSLPSEEMDVKPKTTLVRRELPTGYKRLVKVFTSFHKHLRAEGVEIYFDWSNIDREKFTYYRQYDYNGNVTVPAPSRLVKPDVKSEDVRPNTTIRQTPVEQFKKSIKRDKSDFTVLKDKKQFKSWHQNLLATAAAQDVEEVLDPEYKPSN